MSNPSGDQAVTIKTALDMSDAYRELSLFRSRAEEVLGTAISNVRKVKFGAGRGDYIPFSSEYETGGKGSRITGRISTAGMTQGGMAMKASKAMNLPYTDPITGRPSFKTALKNFPTEGSKETMKRVAGELQVMGQEALKGAKATDTLGKSFEKLVSRSIMVIPTWMAMRTVWTFITSSFQKGVASAMELETALAEIKVASDASSQSLEVLGKTVLAFSTNYGVSAKDSLNAAKLFAQQGLSIAETIEMTKVAMIGSVILGDDVKNVVDSLTAATRAFNIPVEESIGFMDKWMAVQKKFAVTSVDLSDAVKTAGATATAVGVSHEEYLGHVTAIIETTRRSGTQAANSLQAIYSRIQQQGVSAMQNVGNVPMFKQAGTEAVTKTNTGLYRNVSEVLLELSLNWKNLTEAEKIYVARNVGSQRQIAPFIAMMDNYKTVIEAEVVALNSSGESMKSLGTLQDTLENKTKRMTSAWTEFLTTLTNTSPFKFVVDELRRMMESASITLGATRPFSTEAMAGGFWGMMDYGEYDRRQKLRDQAGLSNTAESDLIQAKNTERALLLRERVSKLAGGDSSYSSLLSQIDETIGGQNLEGIRKEIDKLEEASIRFRVMSRMNKKDIRDEAKINAEIAKEKQKIAQLNKYDKLEREANSKSFKKDFDVMEARLNFEAKAEIVSKKNYLTKSQSLQIELNMIKNSGLLYDYDTKRTKELELQKQILIAQNEEVQKLADEFTGALGEGIKGYLTGQTGITGIFGDLNKKIGDVAMSTSSRGIADSFMSLTGLDSALGGAFDQYKKNFGTIAEKMEIAHKTVYEWIVKGHRDGLTGSTSGSSSSSSSGGGLIGKLVGGIGNILGIGAGTKQSTGGFSDPYANQPANYTTASGEQVYMDPEGKQHKAASSKSGIGSAASSAYNFVGGAQGIAQGAMVGYGFYQNARAQGTGVGGSLASGVMGGVGSMLMSSGNPYGMVAGLALTMLSGLFVKKKKQEERTIETQVNEGMVASKIDVTNKSLEIVNRNLIGLRTDIRTYILPSSAYFSEKLGLQEEEFALMSRRGFLG